MLVVFFGDVSNYKHRKRESLGCSKMRLGRAIREDNPHVKITIRIGKPSYVDGFARNQKFIKKNKPVSAASSDVRFNRNYDVGPHSVVYTPRVRAFYRPLDETTSPPPAKQHTSCRIADNNDIYIDRLYCCNFPLFIVLIILIIFILFFFFFAIFLAVAVGGRYVNRRA